MSKKIVMESTEESKKNESLQLKLNSQQKDVISRAAKIKQTTITNFILENSYEAAIKIINQQTLFLALHDQVMILIYAKKFSLCISNFSFCKLSYHPALIQRPFSGASLAPLQLNCCIIK